MAQDSAITTYGSRHDLAPEELDVFSFLIGKWEGSGKTRLADGTVAEYDGLTWIGRYILDGMVIADELHTPQPDGSPGMGITLIRRMSIGSSSFSMCRIRSFGGR